jgi:hypothetical protein
MRYAWLFGAIMLSCGGGWTPADSASSTDALLTQVMIETICASDDGGCKPSEVRSLEREAYCGNASMLSRHGGSPPDAGIVCQ